MSYFSYLFSLRLLQAVETTPICKWRDEGVDMDIGYRDSWPARNPNQGLCEVL